MFAWLRMNRTATAVLALVLILTTACSSMAGYHVRAVTIGPNNWLLLRDVAGYYGLTYAVSGQDIRMRSAAHSLQITMDRREMRVDGQSVWLGTAPATYHGAVIIRDQDFRAVIDPILRPASVPRQIIKTVLIDPGHGGNDQGASSRRIIEKNLTLRISRRVAEILRQRGYRAILSRETDRFIPLEQRDAIADRQNADLFVCIHANSAIDHSVGGIETFALPPRGASSTYEKRVSTTRKRGNQYDPENTRLAYDVHRGALAATGTEDRGIKRANFAVLREAPCPAVLIEIGFISNSLDEARLQSPGYQEHLAQSLANGITAYARNVRPGGTRQ